MTATAATSVQGLETERTNELPALVVTLVVLVGIVVATLAYGTRGTPGPGLLVLTLGSWAVFAVACWLVRAVAERTAVALIVGVGTFLQLLATLWPPRTSDDVYRYAWDGHVGNSGIDPYAYAPTAHQLDGIRLDWLFPNGQPPLINRPDVHTIYPPVAQLWFRLVDEFSPTAWGVHPYQVSAAAVAVAGTLLLLRVLRSTGADPRLAAAWAWCPIGVHGCSLA